MLDIPTTIEGMVTAEHEDVPIEGSPVSLDGTVLGRYSNADGETAYAPNDVSASAGEADVSFPRKDHRRRIGIIPPTGQPHRR